MLNIALVGASTMGGQHAANFDTIDGCRLAKIYDTRLENAQALAAQYRAVAVDDVDEIYADDIDIVAVTCPTPWHADYCTQAAEAGKAIFCEKPLARTIEQGKRIVDAVKDAGVPMMVGHVVRFFPEYASARDMVQAGDIGDIGMVRVSRMNTMPAGTGGWFADYALSGGVTLDMSIHDLDWLLWTFGEVDTVLSRSLYEQMPEMDYALISMRFKSGAIAHLEGSWADLGAFRTSFEVAGSNGLIRHDSTENVTLTVQQRDADEGLADVQVPAAPTAESPYLVQDRAFIEAVAQGTEPPVTVADAYDALELALAALESAETGEIVRL
ncbi:MAG: Gfo/Idh/MocA family protein [Armatimonadota bacterium]